MTDPRYEFFNTSVDQEANLALVQQISAAAVASLRPKEAEFTTYAFDEVLRRAARGEVMRVGAGTEFGLGGAELLLFVVVPLRDQCAHGRLCHNEGGWYRRGGAIQQV